MMTSNFRKYNSIAGWVVWAIATFTYCSTIEPTASFWDCGEYIACAYKLEVGHPPGAPFFLLIGRFFTLLAGADPALAGMMVNIMSGLSSSFTILFLFWTISRIAIRLYGNNVSALSQVQQWVVIAAAAIGSLAYTFSDSFWFSAVEGEVYAMSSFFTAVVFWAILRWDEEDSHSPVSALRWLVLISYLVGLSIGVHLLNLLVIPAIGFIVYFKKYKFTWKGFIYAGIVSVLVLGFVQTLLIPKIVKFVSDYEIFFTNKGGLPYSTGTAIFFVLLITSLAMMIRYTVDKNERFYKWGFYAAIVLAAFVVLTAPGLHISPKKEFGGAFWRLVSMGGIIYAIHKFKTKTIVLNTVFLSFATLLIGYSTFFVLVIRSQANPPMDENDPENAPNMLSYLLREQYGDWPLLYGQYYNAPQRPRREFGSGDPIYAKDRAKGNYKVIDDRKFSIAKYDKEFCTVFPRMYSPQSHHEAGYKYWGNVAEHHRKRLLESRDGEPETVEVPTMAANLTYFFRYQVNYMYLRYLYWNFVGRQNDVQGTTGNNMDGNWVSGIPAYDDFRLDYDTGNPIWRDKNSFARNHFYALPLLLGIMGLIFHFRRHKPDAWVVLSFFLLTGLAIVIYLNQSPYQPRERDYAYTGSFYAFAIWIGLGMIWLFDFLSRKMALKSAFALSVVLCLIVPGLMAAEGWNDHNRSLRTLSRDVAINYLQSCAPNAIIFTNGDNDTFPLWYAQEVEGVRTDVRVVNLSLLQTDWYIRQMRRAAYESAPVPFSIPEEKLEAEKMSYLLIDNSNKTPMDLKSALAVATSDDPNSKYDTGTELLDILPTGSLYVDVDPSKVMGNKVLSDTSRIARRISWDLGGRSYVTKNDLMVLDLIANNNWERPIYFAVTTGDDAYVGLKKYFQLEGLAYRFVPVKQTPDEEAQGGRVNTDVMYDNVMNKWYWGGMDKPGVNLDENCTRMAGNLRMQMAILAGALISEGKAAKAKEVLDKCLKVMPEENIPFDASVYSIAGAYYELKETEKANALARRLFEIYEHDLKVYNAQKPNRRHAYGHDISQAKEILRRLTGLTQQFGQQKLYDEFMKRLPSVMGPEDFGQNPPQPAQIPLGGQ
jgi:hypothetical protein